MTGGRGITAVVRSMTGYGRGVATRGAVKVTVELRAVNHRFLDIKHRTGASVAVEEAVNAAVRDRLERGAITVAIRVERGGGEGGVRIDRGLATAVHRELAALAGELGLAPPTLADVLAQPGVVSAGDPAGDELDDVSAAAGAAAAAALDALIAMRGTEGKALARELGDRVGELDEILAKLTDLTARAAPVLQARLTERIARLCDPGAIDPDRLAQEVALLADKADVTEELVRAKAHLEQLRTGVRASGSVGRRLDFLSQELGRELNTLGAKSSAPGVAALVVDGKTVLEKIREQVQNLE